MSVEDRASGEEPLQIRSVDHLPVLRTQSHGLPAHPVLECGQTVGKEALELRRRCAEFAHFDLRPRNVLALSHSHVESRYIRSVFQRIISGRNVRDLREQIAQADAFTVVGRFRSLVFGTDPIFGHASSSRSAAFSNSRPILAQWRICSAALRPATAPAGFAASKRSPSTRTWI